MKDLIRVLTNRIAITMIVIILWVSLFSGVDFIIDHYTGQLALQQINGGDFEFLVLQGLSRGKNIIHFIFGVITMVILVKSGLSIHDEYELVKTAKQNLK